MKLLYLFIWSIFCVNLFSQSLWKISEPSPHEFELVDKDTSVIHLKAIITNPNSPWFKYKSAGKFIAYYHTGEERNFLLSNLNTVLDTADQFTLSGTWLRFFYDQEIKGYLGEQSAINGMNSIVEYCPNNDVKLWAIIELAQAGQLSLELFHILENNYINDDESLAMMGLNYYASVEDYRQDIKNLILSRLDTIIDHSEFLKAINDLNNVDHTEAVSILDNKFREKSGDIRYDFFFELSIYDPNNQMERSMWVIPQEPDEFIRSEYFPLMYGEGPFDFSSKYFSPQWIKFMKDWLQTETSPLVSVPLDWNIKGFKPAKSESSVTVSNMLDTLTSLINVSFNYNWLSDENFSNNLKDYLQSSKTKLTKRRFRLERQKK